MPNVSLKIKLTTQIFANFIFNSFNIFPNHIDKSICSYIIKAMRVMTLTCILYLNLYQKKL